MQKLWLLPLTACYLAPTLAQAPVTQAPNAQAPQAESGQRPISQVIVAPTDRPQPSETHNSASPNAYERLRNARKAPRLSSLEELRAQAPALAGHVVELKGEVVGILSRARGRVVLLKVGEAVGTFPTAPEVDSDPALRPGIIARLLLDVGEDAGSTIIGVTDKPELVKAEIRDVVQPIDDPNDIIVVVPPVSDNPVRSRGNGALPPAPRVPVRSTPAPPSVPSPRSTLRATGSIEAQKPAYKALVQQHNPKLRADQLDEIVTALLNAAYGNNMDPRFLAAIIAVESDFNIFCRSSSGAMGLGQLMPFNLREAGINDPWNPTQNIHGTARLLRRHLNDYRKMANGTLLAVAAYNAGPGAVRRAGYKVPAGAQVQRYVWKVYYRYKAFAPELFK